MENQPIRDMFFPVHTVQGGYKINNYKHVLEGLASKLSTHLNSNNDTEPTATNLEAVFNNVGLSIIGVNTSNNNSNILSYYIDVEISDLDRVLHLFNISPNELNVKNQRTFLNIYRVFRNRVTYQNISRIKSPVFSGVGRIETSLRSDMFNKLKDILGRASEVTDEHSPYLSYPKLRHNKPIYATFKFNYNLQRKAYALKDMDLESVPYRKRIVNKETAFIPFGYPYRSLIYFDGRDNNEYFRHEPINKSTQLYGSGIALPNIYTDTAHVCWGSNQHRLTEQYQFSNLKSIPNDFLSGQFNMDLESSNIYLKNLKKFINECTLNYKDLLMLNRIPQHELGFSQDIIQLLTLAKDYFNKESENILNRHQSIKDMYLERFSNDSIEKRLIAENIFNVSKNGDYFPINISSTFLILVSNLTHTPLDSLHGNQDEICEYLSSLYKLQYIL